MIPTLVTVITICSARTHWVPWFWENHKYYMFQSRRNKYIFNQVCGSQVFCQRSIGWVGLGVTTGCEPKTLSIIILKIFALAPNLVFVDNCNHFNYALIKLCRKVRFALFWNVHRYSWWWNLLGWVPWETHTKQIVKPDWGDGKKKKVFKLRLCAALLAPSGIAAWKPIWGLLILGSCRPTFAHFFRLKFQSYCSRDSFGSFFPSVCG